MKMAADFLDELFQQEDFPYCPECNVHHCLGGRKIILYGAGNGLIPFMLFVMKRYGFRAEAILDRQGGSGKNYEGIPIYLPEEYQPSNSEKAHAVVVITVGRSELHPEIRRTLRQMGWQNIVTAAALYEYHLPLLPAELVNGGFDYYRNNRELIRDCFARLADQTSREVFVEFLQTHMRRQPSPITSRPASEQYFPADVPMGKGYRRTINCGSYIGDTIRHLHANYGRIEALAGFEPDEANFCQLADYLSSQTGKIAASMALFPCGVYDREAQLHFQSGNRTNSALAGDGNRLIQCVSLDHALPDFAPTFLNMDIEGAELQALRGAENLIRQNQPDLAICVYHAPHHLWQIPTYLHQLVPEYRLYLRNYTSFPSETVLYATA